MMKKVFTLALIGLCSISFAQKSPKLLGLCSPHELEKEPYASWYTTNYQAYSVDAAATSRLTQLNLKKYTIKVIFGSWCGDSKREVPRFLKLLNAASFPVENLQLIGVQDSLQFYKQSPGHEERGVHFQLFQLSYYQQLDRTRNINRSKHQRSRIGWSVEKDGD